jgi:Glycosyl transferase family 2
MAGDPYLRPPQGERPYVHGMTPPTLGLALIARDEEGTLPGLLASIEGAFDQVALADTGSTDRTVEVFEEWAAAEKLRNPDFEGRVGGFEWCDDFAAARNYADSLLDTDWLAWADCDDVIVGADRLRGAVAGAPGKVKHLGFAYLITEPDDHIVRRERIARRDRGGSWVGRLHEVRPSAGVSGFVEQDVAHWVTRRSGTRESSRERNAHILRRWASDEPENSVPLRLLAAQETLFGSMTSGLEHVDQYLQRFREPVMSAHESELARWALHRLTQTVEAAPPDTPPERRSSLHPLLVIALDCTPRDFTAMVDPTGEVKQPAPPPAERRTRQQKRAEARARAKELAAA